MNRLPSLKASKLKLSVFAKHHTPSAQVHALSFDEKAARRGEQQFPAPLALFAPLHYERNYAYPLIVWLHGDGGNERELRQVMALVSVRNYVAAAPRGYKARSTDGVGYTWPQTSQAAAEAGERVRQCIEAANRRFNVHANRVFIAGYGIGGTMALRLALESPERFAGAISLSGSMPSGNCPLKCVNQARGLPLLLASAVESRVYTQARVADDLRLLHCAGFSLALRQYLGEHDLTTAMLADMDRWMMEQVCAGAASLAPAGDR